MPIIENADLTGVSTKFEPLPDGAYRVRITEGEYIPGDRPQVRMKLTVVEPEDYAGRKLTDFISLSKKDGSKNEVGQKQLKRYFEAALGEEAANTPNPNTDDLADQEVMVELKQEEYEGNINNKVKKVVAV